MAKKLVLAPDRYIGSWAIGDTTVSGSVDLREGRNPVGSLAEVPENIPSGEWFGFPHHEDAELLRGRLQDNLEVVLLRARLTHWFPGRARMKAQTALVGAEVPEDLLFSEAQFQVGGLAELATAPPLEQVSFPRELNTGGKFEATWGAHNVQCWDSGEGDRVELKFIASVDYHGGYGLSVRSSPVVRVVGEPRPVEEWMSSYVLPMAEIATVATDCPQPVSWVQVRPLGEKRWPVQVFRADIDDQTSYDATEPEQKISEMHASLVPLGPGGADLAEVLTQWCALAAEHPTLHEYLTLLRRDPKISPRARFLAVVPALEGLHDALHGPPPSDAAERQRTEVLDRVLALPGLDPGDRDYLNENLARPAGYKLAQRLDGLVQHDLSEQLRALILRHTAQPPAFLALTGVNGAQTIWQIMATARNRIAHGKHPVPTERQIIGLGRLAHTIATALALRKLSVPDTALRAGIEHERWPML